MKCLNIGCGSRFCYGWTNVDLASANQEIISYDITRGLPFSDLSFDLVYHSHVLEHLSKINACGLLKECYRILGTKGILRVVVPDLEQISRIYLHELEKVLYKNEPDNNYSWILLELFDQMVRNHSGGEMLNYFLQPDIPNLDFVIQRIGREAESIRALANQQQSHAQKTSLKEKLKSLFYFLRDPSNLYELFLKFFLKKEDLEALRIGRFRMSGEVHQWMYDRYSLRKLLSECGFVDIVQRTAYDSYIPNWTQFNLDTEPDGTVYKPDSLYMEAIKP